MKRSLGLAVLILGVVVGGCRRPVADIASVSIQIPTAKQFRSLSKSSQTVSSQSVVDFNLLCFAVNIKGPAVTATPASTCDIERGLFSGSVGAGATLIVDVPEGSNFTFELYGILRGSTTEACPTGLTTTWGASIDKVYFLGKTTGVTITPPSSEVAITAVLPDQTQSLVAQNSLPATCKPGSSPASSFGRVQTAAAVMSGTTFKVYSRASNKDDTKTLQGAQFKVINWRASAH